MHSNIATLPIELRIKILHHLPSPPSLLSAILSNRSLYTAYRESRTSITASVLQNSTSESSVYCNFLTYALLIFHQKQFVTFDRLHKFIRSYLSFANPGSSSSGINGGKEDTVPWEICPPPSFYNLRTQVHTHIFLWATKFCESKLHENPKIHPVTRHPIAPTPPTNAEIARAARAFYQYFIYTILSTDVFFHSDDMDNMGRPATGRPSIEVMGAFVEGVGYRDRRFIEWFLKEWMVESVCEVVGRCVMDEKNPVRREPGRWVVTVSTLEHKVNEATQALITRLGPVGLWKYTFESTYDEQFKVYCQAPAALDKNSFWPWAVLQTERKETEAYDPRLRICTNSIEVGGDGVFEWWGKKEGVMKKGILWDDVRLERMGLQWPKVEEGVKVQWYKMDTKWKDRELAMGECDCY